MIYIQETNSVIVPPPLLEDNLFISDHLDDTDETYSDRPDLRFPSLSVQNLIRLWYAMGTIEDESITDEMGYIQETNSAIVRPDNLFILDDLDDKEETYSGRPDLRFLPLSVQNLITPAWSTVGEVENENIADEARRILLTIAETILIFQSREVDLGHLPQLHAFDVQDGSMLIEWIFDDFRIGFSIEPTPTESSWYLVSNAKLGDIGESGNISQNEFDTQNLISELLAFVISHV